MVGDGGFFFLLFPGGAQSNVVALLRSLSILNLTSAPLATCSEATEGRERDETGSFQYGTSILMSSRHLDFWWRFRQA